MALIAEHIVEEWMSRQGYFTIRGIRIGNAEMDLIGIKLDKNGKWKRLHVEVQASTGPVKYISDLTKERRNEYNISSAGSAKRRTDEQLKSVVEDWVNKKFFDEKKKQVRQELSNSNDWEFLFVHGKVKELKELDYITSHGIKTKHLSEIFDDLEKDKKPRFKTLSGTDILELFRLKLHRS